MGRKLGMTQLFNDEKQVVPVTVIEATPNVVLQVKNEETDGYHAVKIGFEETKPNRINRPDAGQFKAADCAPMRFLQEIRLDKAAGEELAVGKEITVKEFSEGEKIDATGTSKGRGYTGVIKRHNFKTAVEGHGTHEFFRHGGAIGMATSPAHVFKGMKMPGQHGNVRSTTQNLIIARVDEERNLLFIRGAVPGAKQGLVFIQHAVKGK